MERFILGITLFFLSFISFAQPTQTVRGQVIDYETNRPLTGVKVEVITSDTLVYFRTRSDANGDYKIPNVPIGKHQLHASILTYDPKSLSIEVNSGKESIVLIGLQESFLEQAEVTITARKKGDVINEMATVSARQFSVEESNRYAGSRMDPARMASNFAGVQGADDSRNDIIVRGNSPLGILWKIEGIDIPNPSHFATAGSSGGPVTALNNKILANSDFFMSAFPAEFGNSIAGVFDLKLRNGNNLNHEFTGQFGFLGTEFLAEGPMNREKKSSYLVMGRYSTLSLFQRAGIQIGTSAVPVYGDVAFKFNWNLKKGGNLSFFGMGGKSQIEILVSEQTEATEEAYGEGDRDQYFGTSMGTMGLVYKKSINEKTFFSSTLALSGDASQSKHNFLIRSVFDENVNGETVEKIRVDSIFQLMGYRFQTTRLSYFASINHKINRRLLLKAGINIDGFYVNQTDSVLIQDSLNAGAYNYFRSRWDYQGFSLLIQPFAQWKFRITENMDVTAGVHAQYYSGSNSISPFEPRVGWKYNMKKSASLFAGAGLHSQMQPLYIYNYHLPNTPPDNPHNRKMDFTRSIHTAAGFEKAFKNNFSIRTETYYQYLYNIPVEVNPSSFSMVNMGSGFQRFFPDTLQNTGDGFNYGVELTLQKYFDKSFFFLVTGSLYNSKYRGSDKILRNTSYNGNYVVNVLAGKEVKLNQKNILSFGLKVTTAGGQRFGIVDTLRSADANELIFLDSGFNENQFRDYFRFDVKLSWKLNAQRVTHEIGLDLVNIFGTENILSLAYAPNLKDPTDFITERLQLGFLPIFYYKIDFRGKKKS